MNREKYIQNSCVGCGLCNCVNGTELKKDVKGFVVPMVKKEHIYEAICPVYHYMEPNMKFFLWGEYVHTYAGYSLEPLIRHGASSGGALTAIAIYLLKSGTVDAVIHIGASADNPLETCTCISTTEAEIIARMGSRYGLSTPLTGLTELLKNGKKYAYIGKPCDVAALKRYMKVSKRVQEQIVCTLSFFCAGMPSDEMNRTLVRQMGCIKENLISFQYRGNGWPGYTTAKDCFGKEYRMDYRTAWGEYLGRDVNKICRYCMDGIGESADIVCADLWYLNEQKKPDFSEHEGRNIIFSRNEMAQSIIQKTADSGRLHVELFDQEMKDFHLYQPHQFTRRVTMKYRVLAVRLFGHYAPKYDVKLLNAASIHATTQMKWDAFKGTVKRILQGKI